MTTPFLDLLQQIANGVIIYEPFRRTAPDLQEFQDTVHRLQEMERLGLISTLFRQLFAMVNNYGLPSSQIPCDRRGAE